ncbi:MAG: D-alanine--D-alanine ligase [Veillonellaceae bacterium]|nr:D-alanine--D-alanine ligase [Veillonellaceae bacterium]
MKLTKDTKILVVLGGPSTEAEVSRRTGAAVAQALQTAGYPVEVLEFVPATAQADIIAAAPGVVFNALHGRYGEDGAIQHILEMSGIPYTGSGPVASAVTVDKVVSKRLLMQAGLPTAEFTAYTEQQTREEICADIRARFTFPVVIKAPQQGSTIGIRVVHTAEELAPAVDEAFRYDSFIMAERFLAGDEFTASVLNGKVLPLIRIVPHSGMYDYTAKYTAGATDYLVPAPISPELTQEMQALAKQAYELMGCCGVARVDFMTDTAGKPYILELNTVPGMTTTSLVPKAAQAVGIDFTELCEDILRTAACGKL